MSVQSQTLSDKRRMKELKVLQLHEQGYSYRKIASLVHLSLRDVTEYIHRISNKTKSPSTTSVMDEVVLEYRISGMKLEIRDLAIERDNLKNDVNDLGAQKYQLQIYVSFILLMKNDLTICSFSAKTSFISESCTNFATHSGTSTRADLKNSVRIVVPIVFHSLFFNKSWLFIK